MEKPVVTIPEGVHAILSASKSATWLACVGALGAAKGGKGKPNSRYAAEGTVYHDVARRALTQPLMPDCADYIGDRYKVGEFEFTVDESNAIEAQKYVDIVRAIPGKLMVEVDIDYAALLGLPRLHEHRPIAAGTSDAVVIDYEHSVLHGLDLKFGRGDIVYAKGNTQLRLYLAGVVAKLRLLGITDDWLVKMYIVQPRVNHYDSDELTVGELMAWVESIKPEAQRAYNFWLHPEIVELGDLTPTEKGCRWCPLSGNCKAQDAKMLAQFPTGHAEAAIPSLVTLDDVQLADALGRADEMGHYLSAVRAEGLARALQGHTLPNWKLVEGRRGNRTLADGVRVQLDVDTLKEIGVEGDEPTALPVEDAIYFALKDAAFKPRDLKTVAQLQKPLEKKAPLLWAALQACVTQADGKPSLEKMEDPRPPMTVVSSEFPLAPTAGGLI
jgi:hypothetical protein